MSVMGKNGGKRASKAFLFTTSALLLVVLVSLSFPVPADAFGRVPNFFKLKSPSPPPKEPLYMPPTPPKKSPPPVPKKPPHYVPSIQPKKPVTPMKPKSPPPPPYTPDLTTTAKFTIIPKILRKSPSKGIPGFGNIPIGITPPSDESPYRLRNPPPPRYRYRGYPRLTPPRYGWYPRYPPPRN